MFSMLNTLILLGLPALLIATPGTIHLHYSPTDSIFIYKDGHINNEFVMKETLLNCSNHKLFTYYQTTHDYLDNSPVFLEINNFSSKLSIGIKSEYGVFTPTASLKECMGTCIIKIFHNCQQVNYFKYFDIVEITIPQLANYSFTYNVICDDSKPKNSFAWGEIVLITTGILIISACAYCSRAWSWNSWGVEIRLKQMIIFFIVQATGISFILSNQSGLLSVVTYTLVVSTFICGSLAIMIIMTELIYLLPLSVLHKGVNFGLVKIRLMDMIGFVFGIAAAYGWWRTSYIWVISDFIDLCITAAVIKIFKFTSLKFGLLFHIIATIINVIFYVVFTAVKGSNYSESYEVVVNSAFVLQVPTITPVPNKNCSKFYLMSFAFPGVLLSYLVRFDYSRCSRVYSITFLTCYISCSLAWVFITIVSPFSIPFDVINVSVALVLISVFAYKRNELAVIWSGKFEDHEYRHRSTHTAELMQVIKSEKSPSKFTMSGSIFNGLEYRGTSDLESKVSMFKFLNRQTNLQRVCVREKDMSSRKNTE